MPTQPRSQTAPGAGAVGGGATNGVAVDREDLPGFCERPGSNAVRDVFCGAEAPVVRSLADLQTQLGIKLDKSEFAPADQTPSLPYFEGYPERALLMLNTSTALPSRFISTINPRAIFLGHTANMAFNRGVQQVEMISSDRDSKVFNLYLLRFVQACNSAPGGCTPGDLYTPRVESDWLSVTIEDDEQLKNTPFDCRQCHQRNREDPILLMRELDGPWTHFFQPEGEPADASPEATGVEIVRAYHAAKGRETYAGAPWEAIRSTIGFVLQSVMVSPQPVVFDSGVVSNERWPWSQEAGYADKPERSETWYREFEAFKRGEHLALPHYEPFPTDPDKLAKLTDIYRRYREGEIDASQLPDLSDVYPDDPVLRAELGFLTEPSATPAQSLIQACGSCHNDVLDQRITRARFNIDLARMDSAALALAVQRMELPLEDPEHMPPKEFRQIAPEAIAPLLGYLNEGRRSAEDDALLRRAAELGMAVPLTEYSYKNRATDAPPTR
jgi:hypothetical protein